MAKSSLPIFVVLSFLLPFFLIPSGDASDERIRESVIAGAWYSDDPLLLRREIEGFLKQVTPRPSEEKLLSLIVPHAGYRYSGQVAAHAYKLLEKKRFDTVVIVAPSHYARFAGVSVYDRGGYRTPLGTVSLDHEMIRAIRQDNPEVRYVEAAHVREHSLEIQLPFLQVVMPGFKLVPLIMGDPTWDTCRRLACTLARCGAGKSILLVASSDLSHYHPDEEAGRLDGVVMRHVRNMDARKLSIDLATGECEACGGGPMVSVILASALLGGEGAEILNAANSGDVSGDRKRVVGYLAAGIHKGSGEAKSFPEVECGNGTLHLTPEDKAILRQIARSSLEACVSGKEAALPPELPPNLKEISGAFVTLKKEDQLRGCIGHVIGRLPLAETVSRVAASAALHDRRFRPVDKGELPSLECEISVLSPLQPITDVEAIRVGTHGILIRQENRSGLLLPQVATEYGWDRVTFLDETCAKAGLPKKAWKDPETRIYVFTAEVF